MKENRGKYVWGMKSDGRLELDFFFFHLYIGGRSQIILKSLSLKPELFPKLRIAGKEEDWDITIAAGHNFVGVLKGFGNRSKEQVVWVLFCSFRTV